MINLRTRTVTLAILAPAALAACSPSPKPSLAASAAPPRPLAHNYTLDTPVKRIAADPQGKAILVRDVPGLMASKSYALFDDMSLSEIAILSHGRLTKTKLALVKSDLVELSDAEPAD